MMLWLTQTVAVTTLSLRSLGQRLGSSSVAVVGFAGVVSVFVAILSISEGFRRVMERGVARDIAVVLRGGSDSETSSGLSLEQARIIKEAPGILRGPDGPIASAEAFVVIDVPKRGTGTDANVPLRGVEAAAFLVRKNIEIVEGRLFNEGRNEVIVGRAAARQFAGLEVSSQMRWGENTWEVVGVFAADDSVYESEIWTDVRVLQSAYRRGTTVQSIYARLESADAFQRFKATLTSDPRLEVNAIREEEYYAKQSEVLRTFVSTLGNLIAAIMAVGATFGAINTMYSSVAVRGKEVATLRALGFQSGAVLISVMVESLILALIGALLGGGLAYLIADGYQTATMNWQSFSQVAFRLAVTPHLLISGVVYGLVMGFVGGIFPAVRAVRTPIVVGLKGS